MLAVSGVIGYLSRPGGNVPLADTSAANRARRADWQRRTDAIIAENARRRRATSLHIRAGGPAVVIEQGERAP